MIIVLCLSSIWALAQQPTLIGHQEFLPYYNPSLLGGGRWGHVSFVHRSQWENLGPTSNTLFAKYPFINARGFTPHAIGMILQYEEISFLTRTNLEFMLASPIANFGSSKLDLGLNLGISHLGVNMSEFNVAELIDPELANIDQRLVPTNRLGLSLGNSKYSWGASARVTDFRDIAEYNTTLSFSIPVARKYDLSPLVAVRSPGGGEYQLEGQIRGTYDDRISLTAGYRQSFGLIFQLGISFNQAKASYGVEYPSNDNSSLGLTHEVLASYRFESPASIRHKEDSVYKVRRDSVNKARIDSLRKYGPSEDEDDLLGIVGEPETQDSLIVITDEEYSKEASDEGVLTFDDLPSHLENNTHVILNHIGFETDLYLLKPSAYNELDRLVSYVQHHRSLHFEIQGHTDNSGSAETNLLLSKLRAQTVYNYLISKGVDPARMNVVGYGESLPLFPNDTKERREMNRRIEVVFIRK